MSNVPGVGGISMPSGGGPLLGLTYLGSFLGNNFKDASNKAREGGSKSDFENQAALMRYEHDLRQIDRHNQNLLAAAHMKEQVSALRDLKSAGVSSVSLIGTPAGHDRPTTFGAEYRNESGSSPAPAAGRPRPRSSVGRVSKPSSGFKGSRRGGKKNP